MGRPSKLSADRWIETGLSVLAAEGFEGLKAETLAKSLNVTRGSFYHHFHDVSDFHRAVIAHWREAAARAFACQTAPASIAGQGLDQRLQGFLRICLSNSDELEHRIRLWAQTSDLPKLALGSVDQLRLEFATNLLAASGLSCELAALRASLLYSCLLGVILRGGLAAPDIEPAVTELQRWAFERQQVGA